MKYPETWKPLPIDQFYGEDEERLLMWEVLEIKEEKRVPFYADEPAARSQKVDLYGINRNNFNPRENFDHLRTVAVAIGLGSISVDIDKTYKQVLKAIKEQGKVKSNYET